MIYRTKITAEGVLLFYVHSGLKEKMITIQHQTDSKRFVLSKDDKECILEYKLIATTEGQAVNHQIIDFSSTYVPFALRGQGLAEQLVEAGLVWAKQQGYQIEASCWYVKKFL
jgi:predicted GNAT family acetyltransferase